MNGAKFGIIDSVKKAWRFTVDNRGYLMRLGFIPLMLQMVTVMFLLNFRPESTVFEIFLWNLPANMFFAWYMFAEVRFLLLGERLDRLPGDAEYLAVRSLSMKRAVLILLLFDMGLTAAFGWVEWASRTMMAEQSALVAMSIPVLYAAVFWALRFSVLHVVAAVGYPLRAFLRRVRGVEFSLRMAGMILLCSLPIYLAFGFLAALLLAGAESVDGIRGALFRIMQVPTAMLASVLMNAAAAYALKEMLGRERAGTA